MRRNPILILIAAALVLVGGWFLWQNYGATEAFEGRQVSFTVPAGYEAREFDLRTVIVGSGEGADFVPQVDLIQYRQDPNAPAPFSYDAFLQAQTLALCGTDLPGYEVSCEQHLIGSYKSVDGYEGERIMLRLTRNGETIEYGPIYAFNQTRAETENNPMEYKALLIYPSFSTFLTDAFKPAVLEKIMSSIRIEDGVSEVTGPGAAPTVEEATEVVE